MPTGAAIALPEGSSGWCTPSGLAARLGVTVLNAPGTIDAGYRGEILVNLINHDRTNIVKIARGDRIAQSVIQRVERATSSWWTNYRTLPEAPLATVPPAGTQRWGR